MNQAGGLFLNSTYLKNRVHELGLKQWWLAEQVGVDRKTVIRWLQGKVRMIQLANATALAKILDCRVEDFCHQSEAERLATPEDQRTAAELLASSSVMEKLGPMGEWNVIESLLKATILQDLPLSVLGDLYNQLTVANWRQNKIDQAALYNEKAMEIAGQSRDQKIRAGALLSRANILWWRGQVSTAVNTFQECLSLKSFISEKTIGAIYSNLGAVLFEAGDLENGLAYQERAIENFLIHGQPMNLSIAFCNEAMIFLQMERWAAAKGVCEKSAAFAKQDDYRRGTFMCGLIRAELFAREGQTEDALEVLTTALAGFEKMGIKEGLNFEFAARAQRLLGNYTDAESYALLGIETAGSFPLEQAALFVELAQILRVSGRQAEDVENEARKAAQIYYTSGCPLRLARIEKQFGIKYL
jgi:tetratricopeptide (TPR) repeat protein/DNA-binding Xre family transcriptional regulator